MISTLLLMLVTADPTFRLSGGTLKAGAITQADLTAVGAVTVAWTDRGTAHQVTGVPLTKLLVARGFDDGPKGKAVPPKDKHRGLRAALLASAADGYQAVFSAGELLETLGPTSALVVWAIDGKPLGDAGPFRLVVLTDKEPSRSLHGLVSLELIPLPPF